MHLRQRGERPELCGQAAAQLVSFNGHLSQRGERPELRGQAPSHQANGFKEQHVQRGDRPELRGQAATQHVVFNGKLRRRREIFRQDPRTACCRCHCRPKAARSKSCRRLSKLSAPLQAAETRGGMLNWHGSARSSSAKMLVLERVWARLEQRGRAHWHGAGCCEVAALPRLGGETWFCTAVVLDGDRGECAVCPNRPTTRRPPPLLCWLPEETFAETRLCVHK
eukprot:scaffold11521_cov68-Phaeocystis_antarctica.AAC.9